MKYLKYLFIIFIVLSGCAKQTEQSVTLKFALVEGTGGTAYSIVANGISASIDRSYPGSIVQVMLGSPASNPLRVSTEEVEFGLSSSTNTLTSYLGEGDDEPTDNLRFMAGFNPSSLHIAVNKKFGINNFEDLLSYQGGIRLRIAEGSVKDLFFALASAYNVSQEDLVDKGFKFEELDQSVIIERIADGTLDGYITSSSVPSSLLMQTFADSELVLLQFDGDFLNPYAQAIGYIPYIITSSDYSFLTQNISSFASYVILITTDTRSEELVYRLTKSLIDEYEFLKLAIPTLSTYDVSGLLNGQTIPMHPGAIRAYKESGLIND